MQIFHSLGAVKRGLCSCVSNAFQHRLAVNRYPCAQRFSKQGRLIESAFPLASWMQWHGHDDVKFAPAKTFIVKRRAKPTRHQMSQVNLTPILKVVNDLANNTAATVRSHCCIKVNFAMSAVGACERGRNCAVERLGALLAKWRVDAHGFCFALLAEIFASSSLAAAESAHRRVE